MDKTQVYHDGTPQQLPFSTSYLFSTIKNYKVEILKKAWKNKLNTYIVLNLGVEVGDIIKFKGYKTKFYVKKWISYDATGGSVYQIARLDRCRVSQFDLDNLKPKVTGLIKGYVNKPKR